MKSTVKNTQQSGFVKIILLIVVILILMKLSGLTISQVVEWFKSFFGSVFK